MANIEVDWDVEGIIQANESVKGMLDVISEKTSAESGTFWCWDGRVCETPLKETHHVGVQMNVDQLTSLRTEPSVVKNLYIHKPRNTGCQCLQLPWLQQYRLPFLSSEVR